MAAGPDIRPVDREFYEARLRAFLPARIVDVHCHVWTAAQAAAGLIGADRLASWPNKVASVCPVEDLLEHYRRMLPGKSVTPVIFANPMLAADVDEMNAYAAGAAAAARCPALLLSRPEWSAEELTRRVSEGGFAGLKPYMTYARASVRPKDVRVFDFLPHEQLAAADRGRWVVILHIPRAGRLRDEQNVADLLEIDRRYPDVRLVVAHVGRAYCAGDIGESLAALSQTGSMCFDISANTNAEVFSRLLEAVGPRRVLFGSDLPITRMRMRRACEGGRYVNFVPRGLYGDVSGDASMREVDGPEADTLTLFLYEELDAFRRAAEAAGLSRQDIEAVFADNAMRLLARGN